MFSKCKVASLLMATAFLVLGSSTAFSNNRDRQLTVMTRNMYLGTDFGEIFAAQSEFELITEVAEAYTDVQTGLPQARISAIADEIESSAPALVGLQEVALWRIGEFTNPAPSTQVTYDFLQILLDELDSRGLTYTPLVVQTNLDAEVPAFFNPELAFDVRFTDRVVILARTDLSISEFKVEGTHSGTFAQLLTVPTPTLGNVEIQRGWTSVDAKFRGKTYRFVNTHLEFYHPDVRYAQAAEILQVPGATDRSVILVGDFNSDAESAGDAYQLLLSGGFTDVWDTMFPADAGYTSPLFLADPFSPTAANERIDLILTRGEISPAGADIVGEQPAAPGDPIPSDHAGVVATLVLEP
jgi:hypothetical protein